MKKITSGQNPFVKHWRQLRTNKKYRHQHGRVLIEGKKLVQELTSRLPLLSLISVEPLNLPAQEVFLVSEEVFLKISGVQHPEGVMAEIEVPEKRPFPTPLNRLLVLEEINDPGNLGTLLRTAWALHWDGVFLLGDGCDPYNDKALRAAKGATFSLPLQEGSRQELQQLLEKHALPLYGACMDGEPVDSLTFPTPCALALGNEARGLSNDLLSSCKKVAVPMHPDVESLNVAIAGSILLYQMRKR